MVRTLDINPKKKIRSDKTLEIWITYLYSLPNEYKEVIHSSLINVYEKERNDELKWDPLLEKKWLGNTLGVTWDVKDESDSASRVGSHTRVSDIGTPFYQEFSTLFFKKKDSLPIYISLLGLFV